jgi:hypothetical protein
MPAFFLNAGVLFNIALTAYKDAAAGESVIENVLVACVFSAVAMEAFINELAGMTSSIILPKLETEPYKLQAIAEMLEHVEHSHGPLEMKYELVKWICTGQLFDKGTKPYQDFADLIAVRNELVHYKIDRIPVAEDGGVTVAPPRVIGRLRSRHVLADIPADVGAAWIHRIGTASMARWACETAAAMVHITISFLPDGLIKKSAENGFGKAFQVS